MDKFLKESRQRVGLSQAEVAAQLGYINGQFISNWERGKCRPPLSAWKKLIPIYNLDRAAVYKVLVEDAVGRADGFFAKILRGLK